MASRIVVVSFALLLGSASLASAQQLATLDVAFVEGSIQLSCTETYACETNTECEGRDCVDINASLAVCLEPARLARFEAFCCETVDDCPVRDGEAAQGCAHVAGDIKVCLWPSGADRVYSFCAGAGAAPSLETIAACFGASGINLVGLATGDCDQDGLPNATDSAPCSPEFVGFDGGFPPFDGGFFPFDGDIPVFDGDIQGDGSTGRDGGTSGGPGVAFQGGGGCAVSPSSDDARRVFLALGSLLLGTVLVRGARRKR